ncbi:MAG: hypothetical protein ACR2M6_04165 [Vampirovibrionia bacterium]
MLQEPTSDFNFDNITLGPPNGLQGGSYFTKLLNNNEPIYLQVPKCLTKQGMVVTEKKKYCDLMFTRDAADVISWFENIEKRVHGLLYEKKNVWFHEDLELSDIENAFTSPTRSYKSGYYYLVRCSIPKVISPETISCYNENEEPSSLEEMGEEDVEIIPLIEIQGVKFSSKSFQIEIGLRQVMVIKKKHMFKNCLIKLNKNVEEELDKIPQAEQVQAEQVQVEQVQAEQVQADEVQADEVQAEQVQADEVQADEVQAEQVQADEVQAEQVQAEQVQADEVQAEQVQVEQTLAEQVQADEEQKNIEESSASELQEISIDTIEESEPLVLKKPTDVYYEMWRSARQKAKLARREAVAAYLEAKKIKENYMLEGIDSDSEDENENQQVLA